MIKIKWTERGPTPARLMRELNPILKEAYRHIGLYWLRHMRPHHFTTAGATYYGYAPRSGGRGSEHEFKGSYTARKLKKFGHTRPLEYSGRSRQLTKFGTVKATSKGCRVVMRAPALNLVNPHSDTRPRKELTTVMPREVRDLADEFEHKVQEGIDNIRGSKTEVLVA